MSTDIARRLRRLALPMIGLATLLACGCAKPGGPTVLTLDADTYDAAFDAALEISQRYGMRPSLLNRRHGIIESDPAHGGTVLEPWDRGTITFARAMENTISQHRRRVRFEFTPVVFIPPPDDVEALPGPDLLGVAPPQQDLTQYDGELELRAWVYMERSHTTGRRYSTWTRRATSTSTVIDPATERPVRPRQDWSVVVRDEALERRLLGRIEDRLNRSPDRTTEPADS